MSSSPARSPMLPEPRRAAQPGDVADATEPRLYPVFLKLDGLPVVIVGGGSVAASKLDGLVEAGARITVIAPVIGAAIRTRAAGGPPQGRLPARLPIRLIERAFAPRDLDGARWVVAAATPAVNAEVSAAATRRGVFVNAVDDPAAASAYLGGVIRRGAATVAISTSGSAPALAGLVREALEALLPDELERWIDVARAARAGWKRAGTPIAERRPLLLRALARLYRGDQAAEVAGFEPTHLDAPTAPQLAHREAS